MKEEWKFVKGFGKRYQVSNLGNVRSCINTRGTKTEYHPIKKFYIKHKMVKRYQVYLYYPDSNNRRKAFKLARLIAEAFIPNPENKRDVNHIDGNKTNDILSNLEWVTHKENMQHAYRMGLFPIINGEDRKESKLTEEKVLYARKNKGIISQYVLAREFGVTQPTLWAAQNGKTWKHLNV